MRTDKELEIYFHIPFCIRKCLYCDFLSGPADEDTRWAYLEALMRETVERASEAEGYTVRSVFLGGGTPSVADAGQIQELLELLRKHYRLAEDAEITMEVNPGTVDMEKLTIYHRAGINRLSIGLQSAEDSELAAIGRIHTYEEFLEAYRAARTVGFDNINVDLMGALPGQTAESYGRTLDRVLALNPEHISAYSLIVEENTPLWDMVSEGTVKPWEEDRERELYWLTHERLCEAGYVHYEISNYAKPGRECRHNMGYWTRVDYLGLGIGAASLMGQKRFQNDTDREAYIREPMNRRCHMEYLSTREQMEETMFLGLRLLRGVSEKDFEECFGEKLSHVYGKVIERNMDDGLLQKEQGYVFLTQKGIDISNYVMARFLL